MTDKKQERIAKAIEKVVTTMMDRIMDNVLNSDPFDEEFHHSAKPLYSALVPDEIFKGSHFERRFVTPFGKAWERFALVVAKEAHSTCIMGHSITGNIPGERLQRIQQVLDDLEHSKKGDKKITPNWDAELAYILEGKGNPIAVTVMCDIYIDSNETGKKYAFELKAPLPNSDQTKVSKEKMFKLLAMEPLQVDYAYFALPYNPYGAKENYDWAFPKRWFNMLNDKSVLIGDEFWDLIGGEGTYANLIEIVNTLGVTYRDRIYREYLQIEPPDNTDENLLINNEEE